MVSCKKSQANGFWYFVECCICVYLFGLAKGDPGAAFLFMLQSSDRLDVCFCVLSALVPASQKSRKAVCPVCIQEQSFKKYENGTMKLSVNEAKLTGL